MQNRPYKWLAEYYDEFFNFHLSWFEAARRKMLGGILPGVKTACDLACGTGTTAIALAQRGVRTYALDLSPVMCRLARKKAKSAQAALRVQRADMCDFRLPEPVDLILCEFDALNHMNRKKDLARVTHCAARALKAGGHFYFDVNNLSAFKSIWPGTWFVEKPGMALVMQGGYEPASGKGWLRADWFIKEGRDWRRYRERIEQVAWTPSEIRRSLREAGFDEIRAFDAKPFFKGDPRIQPGCRTFYVATKKV